MNLCGWFLPLQHCVQPTCAVPPQFNDQGLTNTDPRFIAVPDSFINLIPTDVRGVTFNRSPQQVRAPTGLDMTPVMP